METKQLYDGNAQPFYPKVAQSNIEINVGGRAVGAALGKNFLHVEYDGRAENIYVNEKFDIESESKYKEIVIYPVELYFNGNKVDFGDDINFDTVANFIKTIIRLGTIILEYNTIKDYSGTTDGYGTPIKQSTSAINIDNNVQDEINVYKYNQLDKYDMVSFIHYDNSDDDLTQDAGSTHRYGLTVIQHENAMRLGYIVMNWISIQL